MGVLIPKSKEELKADEDAKEAEAEEAKQKGEIPRCKGEDTPQNKGNRDSRAKAAVMSLFPSADTSKPLLDEFNEVAELGQGMSFGELALTTSKARYIIYIYIYIIYIYIYII